MTDANGARGTFERRVSPLESAAGATVAVRLEDGREVRVPARQLVERADGEFTLGTSFADWATSDAPPISGSDAPSEVDAQPGSNASADFDQTARFERAAGFEQAAGRDEAGAATDGRGAADAGGVVPVVEEQLRVGTREIETGRVRFTKRVRESEVVIDEPVVREEVEVVRVPVGREVDGPVPARQEGDTLIVPVLEEVLVVEKRLMLVEELHVRKRRVEQSEPRRFQLRKEEVGVERLEASEGRDGAGAQDFEPGGRAGD